MSAMFSFLPVIESYKPNRELMNWSNQNFWTVIQIIIAEIRFRLCHRTEPFLLNFGIRAVWQCALCTVSHTVVNWLHNIKCTFCFVCSFQTVTNRMRIFRRVWSNWRTRRKKSKSKYQSTVYIPLFIGQRAIRNCPFIESSATMRKRRCAFIQSSNNTNFE